MLTPADLVNVGAGMVGSALALALADSGLSVVLLDRGPLTPGAVESDLPFEPRVSALSLASQRILQRLGAWDGILAEQLDNRHRPCNFVPHLKQAEPCGPRG